MLPPEFCDPEALERLYANGVAKNSSEHAYIQHLNFYQGNDFFPTVYNIELSVKEICTLAT